MVEWGTLSRAEVEEKLRRPWNGLGILALEVIIQRHNLPCAATTAQVFNLRLEERVKDFTSQPEGFLRALHDSGGLINDHVAHDILSGYSSVGEYPMVTLFARNRAQQFEEFLILDGYSPSPRNPTLPPGRIFVQRSTGKRIHILESATEDALDCATGENFPLSSQYSFVSPTYWMIRWSRDYVRRHLFRVMVPELTEPYQRRVLAEYCVLEEWISRNYTYTGPEFTYHDGDIAFGCARSVLFQLNRV